MSWLRSVSSLFRHEDPRAAVRNAYAEHLLHSSLPPGTPPHRAALYDTLRERYLARGQSTNRISLWAELTPFLLMREETSCEAFIEYVVYQEAPAQARVQWLTQVISAALRLPALSQSSPRAMAAFAMIKNVAWCQLLEDDVREAIATETAGLRDTLDDSKLPLPEA